MSEEDKTGSVSLLVRQKILSSRAQRTTQRAPTEHVNESRSAAAAFCMERTEVEGKNVEETLTALTARSERSVTGADESSHSVK